MALSFELKHPPTRIGRGLAKAVLVADGALAPSCRKAAEGAAAALGALGAAALAWAAKLRAASLAEADIPPVAPHPAPVAG